MRMSDLIAKFQLLCPDLTEAMEKNTHHYSREKLNPFHIEGNTYCHVAMTCLVAEMLKMNDIVKIAILLHDVGKPMSTKIDHESQKVKMYSHESLSLFLGLRFLNTLPLSLEEKTRVLQLISFHTALYKAMRDEGFEDKIVEKFKGHPELLMDLIDLSSCDGLGRFTEADEKRDFWMKAQDHLGHLVFRCDIPKIERKTIGEAIVLVGPPCSGKSTWIKNNGVGFKVMSRDEVIMDMGKGKSYNDAFRSVDQDKVNAEYDRRRREVIKTEKQIIFDLTHMTEKSRRKSLAGLPKDMKRTAVVFLTPFEVLQERNQKRNKEEGKFIPAHAMENMMGSFAFPLLTEGFDEIKVIITGHND